MLRSETVLETSRGGLLRRRKGRERKGSMTHKPVSYVRGASAQPYRPRRKKGRTILVLRIVLQFLRLGDLTEGGRKGTEKDVSTVFSRV